jgi:hypothetical protein
VIFPLLPVFVASLGASTTFLWLVEGLADPTSSLLKLASGCVADHTRRKKPLVLFGSLLFRGKVPTSMAEKPHASGQRFRPGELFCLAE